LIVADSLGVERVDLLCSRADVAPYDLEALTTASRHWVRGRAKHSGGEEEFAIFVKVIQSFARSAMFAFVSEDLRAEALCMVPWEAEARVYLSDLGDRLPSGLSMPRALAVVDIDAASAALWLEGSTSMTGHGPTPSPARRRTCSVAWPRACRSDRSPASSAAAWRVSVGTSVGGSPTRSSRRCATQAPGHTRSFNPGSTTASGGICWASSTTFRLCSTSSRRFVWARRTVMRARATC